jgi:hypothetical protein
MLLQATPPDTSAYMIAGYVFFAVIMSIYLASFIIRRSNLEQDLRTLEGIQAESRAAVASEPTKVKARAKAKLARPSAKRAKPAKRRVTRKR